MKIIYFRALTVLLFTFFFTVTYSQTNAEMLEKSSKRFEKIDKELNVVYQKIMKSTAGTQKENIKKAQIAWLKFRDLHCDCESKQHEGGTMESLVHTECLAKLTEERVKQLKIFL